MSMMRVTKNWHELSRAMIGVMVQAPFFSCLLYDKMELKECFDPGFCPTLATDGKHIYIYRPYFNALSLGEQVFAICHEVGHAMFLHMDRAKVLERTGVDGLPFLHVYYNVAGDLVINPMLIASEIGTFKKGWLLDPEVKPDMLVDDVYRWLYAKYPPTPPPKPPPGEGKPCEDGDPADDQPPGPGDSGSDETDDQEGGDQGSGGEDGQDGEGDQEGGKDGSQQGQDGDSQGKGGAGAAEEAAGEPQDGEGGGSTPQYGSTLPDSLKPQDTHIYAESDVAPIEWKMSIESARDHAKSVGKLPGALARVIDKLLEPVVDWRRELISLMYRVSGSDECGWERPNRRWLREYGVYAPGRVGHRIGTVVIVIDTSGSVSSVELKQFAGEMTSILADLNPEATWLLHVDSRVAAVDEIDDPMTLEHVIESGFKGGGGTHMPAAFEWAEKEGIEPDVMVILTDMGTDFGEPQPYPVIWAGTTKAEAPHGYTIFVDINYNG